MLALPPAAARAAAACASTKFPFRCEPSGASIAIRHDRGQWLIDLVGDGCRQFPNRHDPNYASELRTRSAERFFRVFPFGHFADKRGIRLTQRILGLFSFGDKPSRENLASQESKTDRQISSRYHKRTQWRNEVVLNHNHADDGCQPSRRFSAKPCTGDHRARKKEPERIPERDFEHQRWPESNDWQNDGNAISRDEAQFEVLGPMEADAVHRQQFLILRCFFSILSAEI